MLTESWLDDELPNSELNLNNYFIYRADRNSKGNNDDNDDTDSISQGQNDESHIRGGGVLIAVSKHIKSSVIKTTNLSILKIKIKTQLMSCMYVLSLIILS